MGNAWSIAIETICGALETDTRGTFLAQPRQVAPLPRDVASIQRPTSGTSPAPTPPGPHPP